MKRTLRVYADTSVFGGCFDDEFRIESEKFFEEVRSGRFIVVISEVTLEELSLAPERVRQVLADLPASGVDVVRSSEESRELKQAYLDAGVVGPASGNDAAHISLAKFSARTSW